MVSTKIFTASYTEMQVETENLVSNRQSESNFNEILDKQRDNFKVNSKDENDNVNMVSNSSKRDEIQKLYKEVKINKKDEINPEENAQIVAEQVMNYLQNVIEKISEEFNIPQEEVMEGIKELNLELTDLLDMKNISKLVVNLSAQGDMSSLLVDDKLSGLIKEIFVTAEELKNSLKQNLELSDEELTGLLQKVDELIDADEFLTNTNIDDVEIRSDLGDDSLNQEILTGSKEVSVNADNTNTDGQFGKNNSNNHNENNAYTSYEGISIETVISKLQDAVETSSSVGKTGISESIMNQILDGISANISEEMTSLELQLNPESLGKVSVTVSAKEGILTAQIAAQNEIAKEAIESQISVLKESFENQGLKVENVEVTLASKSFDQNLSNESSSENGQSKSRRHISQEELDEINGIRAVEEEKLVEEVLKELGTTVSYQA